MEKSREARGVLTVVFVHQQACMGKGCLNGKLREARAVLTVVFVHQQVCIGEGVAANCWKVYEKCYNAGKDMSSCERPCSRCCIRPGFSRDTYGRAVLGRPSMYSLIMATN